MKAAEQRRGDAEAAAGLEGALMKAKGWSALGRCAVPSTTTASHRRPGRRREHPAKDYMILHQLPETFLAIMVLDGVFEAFPGLRGGCIE